MPASNFATHFTPFMGESESILTFYRDKTIPTDFFPDLPLLYRHILYRRKLNMDTVIVVVGNKRTGKSYFSLKSCEELSKAEGKQYDPKTQCFFDATPFFRYMRSATESFIILEEVGVGYSAQDWFTMQNKIFKNILQTQGFRKNVIFMTLPNIAYLLKGARFLLNFGVETMQAGTVSVNKVVVRHLLGKGWLEYIETIHFGMPSPNIVADYEKMKHDWNDKHLDEDIRKMEEMEGLSNPETKPLASINNFRPPNWV